MDGRTDGRMEFEVLRFFWFSFFLLSGALWRSLALSGALWRSLVLSGALVLFGGLVVPSIPRVFFDRRGLLRKDMTFPNRNGLEE